MILINRNRSHRGKKRMPKLERRKQIESIVNNIIKEHKLAAPGFDLTKFLIREYDFKIGAQTLDKNTTGILIVDDDKYISNTDTNRLISVNRDLGVNDAYVYNLKKRFIIAHEFAHFILHKNNHVQYAHRDTDKKDSAEEREADYFARCLLMPKVVVLDVLQIEGVKEQSLCDKADIVSRLFSVTRSKAKERIEELGLA